MKWDDLVTSNGRLTLLWLSCHRDEVPYCSLSTCIKFHDSISIWPEYIAPEKKNPVVCIKIKNDVVLYKCGGGTYTKINNKSRSVQKPRMTDAFVHYVLKAYYVYKV